MNLLMMTYRHTNGDRTEPILLAVELRVGWSGADDRAGAAERHTTVTLIRHQTCLILPCRSASPTCSMTLLLVVFIGPAWPGAIRVHGPGYLFQ